MFLDLMEVMAEDLSHSECSSILEKVAKRWDFSEKNGVLPAVGGVHADLEPPIELQEIKTGSRPGKKPKGSAFQNILISNLNLPGPKAVVKNEKMKPGPKPKKIVVKADSEINPQEFSDNELDNPDGDPSADPGN